MRNSTVCLLLFLALPIAAQQADLAITGAAENELDSGLSLVYHVTIANHASVTATNVRVHVALADGGALGGTDGGTCTAQGSGAADCTLADLAGGASREFAFAEIPRPSWGHFSSSVKVTWGDPQAGLSASLTMQRTIYYDLEVSNTNDSGSLSLRDAIEGANRVCAAPQTPCRIAFRIQQPVPPSGWFTVTPLTPLPPVTASECLITGETQTGITGDTNPAGPEVEIDGSRTHGDGLALTGNIAEVRGFAVNGFSANGILVAQTDVSHPSTFTIANNYIGVDPSGEVAVPNGDRGVTVLSGHGTISNNVISGNGRSGVFIVGGFITADVTGNRIGVSATGKPLGNHASGIFIGYESNTPRCIVEDNVIAHNRDFGVAIQSGVPAAVRANTIFDNGGMAVDFGMDGPRNSAGSWGIATPQITSARFEPATGETVVNVQVNNFGFHINKSTLYLFANHTRNRAGFAEAERLVATAAAPAEGGIEVRIAADLRGQTLTALIEQLVNLSEDVIDNSSELSEGVVVQ